MFGFWFTSVRYRNCLVIYEISLVLFLYFGFQFGYNVRKEPTNILQIFGSNSVSVFKIMILSSVSVYLIER